MAWGFDRFLFVDQYKPIVDVFSSEMKCPKCVACWAFRRTIRKRFIHVLNTQGNGDLTDEQYHAELLQDVIAFETILGGQALPHGRQADELRLRRSGATAHGDHDARSVLRGFGSCPQASSRRCVCTSPHGTSISR